MTTVSLLLNLLGLAFGGTATLRELSRKDSHWNILSWNMIPQTGERLFRQPPAILFREDTGDLRWAPEAIGMKTGEFTLEDLAGANPDDRAFRHPRIQQIADRIDSEGGEHHPAALMEALGVVYDMCIESAAAICASATGESYWKCRKYGEELWRYRLVGTSLTLPRPHTRIQLDAAISGVSTQDVAELIGDARLSSGQRYVPILSNERAGLHVLGSPGER